MKRIAAAVFCLLFFLTACSKSEPPTWQEQYDLGIRYLSEGNYEEAILAFTAAIEIDPKRAESYAGRADAYLQSGKDADALADYGKVIDLGVASADIYHRVADLYLAAGDTEAALDILRRGIENTGDAALKERLTALESPKPLEGYPKTERGETMVGYCIKEYNEYGNLTRMSFYNKADELTNYSEHVYDSKQKLVKILDEYFAESGGTPMKGETLVDARERVYQDHSVHEDGETLAHYDYSDGATVSISYYDYDVRRTITERRTELLYTMQSSDNVVLWTRAGYYRENGVKDGWYLIIKEYQLENTYISGRRILVCETQFNFDAEGNLLGSEVLNG